MRDVYERPPDDLARLLRELRRRREEAEGRYQLAAVEGWSSDCLRWAGAMLALASLEEWAAARGLLDS
jgi:hypothetical protein